MSDWKCELHTFLYQLLIAKYINIKDKGSLYLIRKRDKNIPRYINTLMINGGGVRVPVKCIPILTVEQEMEYIIVKNIL